MQPPSVCPLLLLPRIRPTEAAPEAAGEVAEEEQEEEEPVRKTGDRKESSQREQVGAISQ